MEQNREYLGLLEKASVFPVRVGDAPLHVVNLLSEIG
jgi:hypothetical protein